MGGVREAMVEEGEGGAKNAEPARRTPGEA